MPEFSTRLWQYLKERGYNAREQKTTGQRNDDIEIKNRTPADVANQIINESDPFVKDLVKQYQDCSSFKWCIQFEIINNTVQWSFDVYISEEEFVKNLQNKNPIA